MSTEIILVNQYPIKCLAPLKGLEDKNFDIRKVLRYATIYLLYDHNSNRLRLAMHNVLRAEPSYFFKKSARHLIGDIDAGHELNNHFDAIYKSADILLSNIFSQKERVFNMGVQTTRMEFINTNSKSLWLSLIEDDI